MPRRKQKIKYSRKFACKHLIPKGDISNSLQPLCNCEERELVLGTKCYVCQVCTSYAQTSKKISEIFEESKRIAEIKIKERTAEDAEFTITELEREIDVDLSTDEFLEEEEELPLKFEKRKAAKGDLEDAEDFGEVECPFCAELILDNIAEHLQNCEFAPDDATIEDILPTKSKKKKPRRKSSETKPREEKGDEGEKEKKACPYCGKEFLRLGRHLNSCSKRPKE